MASDHILWMTILERLGVYDWWSASSRPSTDSPVTIKLQDFPLDAKDFSGGSLFASESWIEGQRFVLQEAITRPIKAHVVNKNPVLLKTCIPLPVEEGVLRPMCPVIQRQPRVEMPIIIGSGQAPSLSQPFVGRNLGFIPGNPQSLWPMVILCALALFIYFSGLINRLTCGPQDPDLAQHPQTKRELDHEEEKQSLTNQILRQDQTLVIMRNIVKNCWDRNQALRDELQDMTVRLTEERTSMNRKDDLVEEQKEMIAERDSVIKKQEAIIAEKESAISEQQATLTRLSEMQEILRQKGNEIKEKESTIARLMEEKQAASEQASALGSTRDRLTKQLEEANKELRSATYFDKDLSRRREEMITKQAKKLHNCTLHIKGLKAQIEGLGQVPVLPPGDGTAPSSTSEEPAPASPISAPVAPAPAPAPVASTPTAQPQSMMESRWADSTPPTQPAAFRGGWRGRGRGRGRGGRRP